MLNEKRKDWKLPSNATVSAASKTNISLGMATGSMDNELEQLWKKYNGHTPNQYWILSPLFKRGSYEKGDSIIRNDSTLIEKRGYFEVYNFKNKYVQQYCFFNTKTKIWYLDSAYLSWEE